MKNFYKFSKQSYLNADKNIPIRNVFLQQNLTVILFLNFVLQ